MQLKTLETRTTCLPHIGYIQWPKNCSEENKVSKKKKSMKKIPLPC